MFLETKRLVLKKLRASDAETYFKLSQNDDFRLFQISEYRRSSIDEAKLYQLRKIMVGLLSPI